jgi:NADPH-dependent F420 reductase
MQIGILGAGNIGGALGTLWAAQGHEIVFGVREPQSYTVEILMNHAGDNARTGTMEEAAAFGEVVALAVPSGAVVEVLNHTRAALAGKILIDCTNRLTPAPSLGPASAAEEVAHLVPEARVVKAFNTLGAENLRRLTFDEQAASTFICGDDPAARAVVSRLGREIGFDVVDAGPLTSAPLVEALAQLWVLLSRRYGRDIAFALLRRDHSA